MSAPAVKPGRGKAPPLGSGSRTTEASVQAKRRNQVAAAACAPVIDPGAEPIVLRAKG